MIVNIGYSSWYSSHFNGQIIADYQVKAKFHYTIQLANELVSWSPTCLRAGQHTGIWPIGRYPAR